MTVKALADSRAPASPNNWDAWDVDLFHLETKTNIDASSVRVLEDGPMRSSVLATYHFGKSVVKVRNGARIESILSLTEFLR